MAQFLLQAAYTSQSPAMQVRDQGNLLERIQPLLTGCEGRADSCFYAVGDYDVGLIADFPSAEQAAAFSLAASAGGSIKTIKTTPLMTFEQGHKAMRRAHEAGKNYVAPIDTRASEGRQSSER